MTTIDTRPWAGAAAHTLAGWPVLAAPLVDAVVDSDTLTAPTGDVVDALAAELAGRMWQVAHASARTTAHEAADQGVTGTADPDRERVDQFAATFAGLIASGYAAVAVQTSLSIPLAEAGPFRAAAAKVKAAVRAALNALGVAVNGLVPTYVGAAMAAAETEGRRAFYEAHPPRYLVAAETTEIDRCLPCTEINGHRYATLDEALADYPTVGYRACKGGIRCRGRLAGVWGPDPVDTTPAPLTEADAPVRTGAMLALVPTAADAARLAVDGGEDPDELHLTLAYLGKADAIDAAAWQRVMDELTTAVHGLPAIDGDVFAPAVFNPTGPEPCRVVLVGGDMLDAVHHFLMDTLHLPVVTTRHAPWFPHITLAGDGDFARLADLADRMGPVRFDRVRLAIAGRYLDIPLVDPADDEDDVDAEQPDGDWALVEDAGDRNNLRTYFTTNPKGLKRWAGKKHAWTALFKILRKHLDPERAKRITSAWYLRVFHHTPNQKLAEAYDPEQLRAQDGKWARVLASAHLKVGGAQLRLDHHGGGRVSVHDEHGGSLHITSADLAPGRRPGRVREFAHAAPLKTEQPGDRDSLMHTEDRGGRPFTTVRAGLTKTHVADEHTPGLHDADEPYLNDRHTLHLPVGGKGVDDPAVLFDRPGTSMTTKDLHDLANTLRAFSDGHENVDTGHGHVVMGINGKEITFDTAKRNEPPIVLTRAETRNVGKALDAAFEAYNPDDGDPLPAGEKFQRVVKTKNGDITITRTGPGSDFWIESDQTSVRIAPERFPDVSQHIDALVDLAGDLKHLTPATGRPAVESHPGAAVQLVEAGQFQLVEFAGGGHPDSCSTAHLATLCKCGCNGAQHGEHTARARLGPVKADRIDREGGLARLQAMSDDELATTFAAYSREGQWDRFEEVAAEMDRREHANDWIEPPPADTHWNVNATEPTEEDGRVDALVARGYDYAEAFAEVYGGDAEQMRRQERTSAVDRRDGESLEQAVRRNYDQAVHEQYLRAEEDTRGNLLTKEAQAAGVNPVDLFSGPADRARKHASEDLQRWWADNGGRTTFTQYRAQVLGRNRDKAAAELTRLGANGKDFV